MYGFFLPRHKRGVRPEADINNPFVITVRPLGEGGLINCKVVRQLHTIARAEKMWPRARSKRRPLSFNSLKVLKKLMKSSMMHSDQNKDIKANNTSHNTFGATVSDGLGFSLPVGRICYNSLIVDVSECFCRLSLDKLGH